MESYDVVVVGGGPAGLNAALIFGRARRRALLLDGGTPRNARAAEVHSFLTRDGTSPSEIRAIARAQLKVYPSVEVRDAFVSSVERAGADFLVTMGDTRVRARRLLLAAGVRDELPSIEGVAEHWGHSVFQCPYCHGWEHRDQPWGVLLTSAMMADHAQLFFAWTDRITAFTNGASSDEAALARLGATGVTVEREPIARLVAGEPATSGGAGTPVLASIALASGRLVPCGALVAWPKQHPATVVEQLSLARDEMGYARADERRESSVPGVYVAGDANTMRQSAISAAADGMMAAAMISQSLIFEDVARRTGSSAR
jgi:thioredoxin reductase